MPPTGGDRSAPQPWVKRSCARPAGRKMEPGATDGGAGGVNEREEEEKKTRRKRKKKRERVRETAQRQTSSCSGQARQWEGAGFYFVFQPVR